MPRVSIFFGIVVYMYYDDHNPQHFHVAYEGLEAMCDFDGKVLKGYIPSKAQKLIQNGAKIIRVNSMKTGRDRDRTNH